jgi:hypothetical protein
MKFVHQNCHSQLSCHEIYNVGRNYDIYNVTDMEGRQELDYTKQYASYKNTMLSQVHSH